MTHRSARLIPEDDQIFTEVELNMLDKVINETMVNVFLEVSPSAEPVEVLLDFEFFLLFFTSQLFDSSLSPAHTDCDEMTGNTEERPCKQH